MREIRRELSKERVPAVCAVIHGWATTSHPLSRCEQFGKAGVWTFIELFILSVTVQSTTAKKILQCYLYILALLSSIRLKSDLAGVCERYSRSRAEPTADRQLFVDYSIGAQNV